MKRLIYLFIMLIVISGCVTSMRGEEATKLKVKRLSKLKREIATLEKAKQILKNQILEDLERDANLVRVRPSFSLNNEYDLGMKCPFIETTIKWKREEVKNLEKD